jgi:hypothetical protein
VPHAGLAYRWAENRTHLALLWARQQLNDWYHSRAKQKRIDAILSTPWEQWIDRTLFDIIFPDTTTLPIDPTGCQLLRALGSGFFYFWYRLFLLPMAVCSSHLKKLPGRTLDVCKLFLDVFADLDHDGTSWQKLLVIFRAVLVWLKARVKKAYEDFQWRIQFISGFFKFIYLAVQGLLKIFLHFIVEWDRAHDKTIPDHVQQQRQVAMRTEWTDGPDHAPNMTQLEIAKLIVDHKGLQYAFGRLLT